MYSQFILWQYNAENLPAKGTKVLAEKKEYFLKKSEWHEGFVIRISLMKCQNISDMSACFGCCGHESRFTAPILLIWNFPFVILFADSINAECLPDKSDTVGERIVVEAVTGAFVVAHLFGV